MKTIDERINDIENKLFPNRIPGTTISRVLSEKEGEGVKWCISIGQLCEPKNHFYGFDTIEKAVHHVESLINEMG